MKIIVTKDYESLSLRACQLIEEEVERRPDAVLGLATGSTPLGTYKQMIRSYKHGRTDYQHVTTFNLDEYVGLTGDHPQSYRFFMEEQLFKYLNVPSNHTYIPNGTADDMEEECERYERLIDEIGPPDLQLLGIGQNGHIGFNEPGTPFDSETHLIKLAESTRKANARFFDTLEDVPTRAITMGIRSILKSKRILLLASGERKAEAIYRLLNEVVDEKFPASSLNRHADVTLIVDEKAYHKVEETGGNRSVE
ncbi:glucosamine-6-phosphate deaminase [Halobacillus fulvus]|nr:glucosamine-6-phosphate deaminase [Halobacillus fulvus]